MSANQILISVIGLFLIATGVIYVFHLREKGEKNQRETKVSYSLIVTGLIIFILPFLGMLNRNENEENKPGMKTSSLLGKEAFQSSVSASDGSHEEASVLYERGVALWRMELNAYDSTSTAMAYFDKSIEAFETAEALTARGQLKVQLSNMEDAMIDYDRAIEITSDFGNAYFNRAALYYIFGDVQKACDDWKKSKEYGVQQADEVLISMCN